MNGLYELCTFFNRINNMVTNIQLTIEIEKNNELSFLDVMLIKNLSNSTLERTVYRKVNKSNSAVPFEITSFFNYKNAPFIFYIRGVFNACFVNH